MTNLSIEKLYEMKRNGDNLLEDKDLLRLMEHFEKTYDLTSKLGDRFALAAFEAYSQYVDLRGYAIARGLLF